jgi:hypothetical protein
LHRPWHLTALTRNGARRWVSIPNVLILVITVIFALLGVMVATTDAMNSPKSLHVITITFAIAGAWRLIGWRLFEI